MMIRIYVVKATVSVTMPTSPICRICVMDLQILVQR